MYAGNCRAKIKKGRVNVSLRMLVILTGSEIFVFKRFSACLVELKHRGSCHISLES